MQYNAINTNKIKEILPHGSITEIAKKSKKSIYTVSRVINGKSKNKDVLLSIAEYIKDIKNVNETLNNVINNY